MGAVVTGVFSRVGGPAQQALVADILPEQQRAQGYGIIRVTFNLSVTLGPAIGGLLATQSYTSLFIADAIASIIVAGIVFLVLPETLVKAVETQSLSLVVTLKGYGQVIRDHAFMLFFLASTLSAMMYMQMNSTLAVYLRDFHGVPEQGFGYILSMNAGMVVLFQFYVTRKIRGYPPMLMITLGTLLYAFGFSMYGFTSTYGMFLLAMVVITIGEMVVAPVGQALVATFAPDDMRGRYMAFFGYSWAIPFAFAPTLAGLLMDGGNPQWVWYIAGVIGLVSTGLFYSMYLQRTRTKSTVVATT
jgi:MFS family permease